MRILKKLMILAIAMILVIGSFNMPCVAQASTITNLITRNFSALTSEFVERGVLYGLGSATSDSENEGVAKAISFTKRILENSKEIELTGISDMCKKKLQQMDAINASLNENFRDMEAQLDRIEENKYKQNFIDQANSTRAFYNRYNNIYNVYQSFFIALEQYSTNPTENTKQNLSTKYKAVADFYADPKDHSGNTLKFDEDLNEFLKLISPYSYNESINESKQPSDSSGWGSISSNATTYESTLWDLANNTYPFEHQVYQQMLLGNNQIATYLNMYLSAQRLYTEFGAQSINTNVNLTEESRQQQVSKMWKEFNTRSYRATRGLEQMISLHGKELSGYMRPYDFDVKNFGMDYQEYRKFYQRSFFGDKTEKWMSAYQFKPKNSDKSFVVLKGSESLDSTDNNMELSNIDLVSEEGYFGDVGPIGSNGRVVNANFLNLKKSYSPGGYGMVKSTNDLAPFLKTKAYKASNQHLITFFKNQGMSNLPDITEGGSSYDKKTLQNGSFLLLDKEVKWQYDSKNIGADVTWSNITQQLQSNNPTQNEVELDVQNQIEEVKEVAKKAPLVMLTASKPKIELNLDKSVGGIADFWTVKSNGDLQDLVSNGNYDSSKPMIIRIKPDDGYTVTGVTLNSVYNQYKIDLIGNGVNTNGSEQSVNTTDVLRFLQVDNNGYYTIPFSVPYQDAIVKVDFAKQTSSTVNTVTLDNQNFKQGELQFQSLNGQSHATYAAGEPVIVYARAHEGYVMNTIVAKDDFETELNVTRLPFENFRPTPNTIAYSFIMPKTNVTVMAAHNSGYSVTLDSDPNGSLEFANVKSLYPEWMKKPVTFNQGEWVVIKNTVKAGFYLSSYEIKGQNTYDSIDAIPFEDGIAFKMPGENVHVKPVYSQITLGQHVVKMQLTGQGNVQLFDENGKKLYGNQYHYAPGTTVKFKALPNTNCELLTFSAVAGADGMTIPLTKDGSDSTIYTFTMPKDGNATIYAEFTPMYTVKSDINEGTEVAFDNSIFTQSDQLSHYLVNQQVKVILHDTAESFVPNDKLTVTYKGGDSGSTPVKHTITTLQQDPCIRLIEFTMPANEVTISAGNPEPLHVMKFQSQNSTVLPVKFNPEPELVLNGNAYFKTDVTNVEVSFADVPQDALIDCEVFDGEQSMGLQHMKPQKYVMNLSPSQTEAHTFLFKYTPHIPQTVTVQGHPDVQVSFEQSTQAANAKLITPSSESKYLKKTFAANTEVVMKAVSVSKDFNVDLNTPSTLISTQENADGTYQKNYKFTMPDRNVFVKSNSSYGVPLDRYTMQYQYIDPYTKKIQIISKQFVKLNNMPDYVKAPEIKGCTFLRWELANGTKYDFNDAYTTDQIIVGIYTKPSVDDVPETGDDSKPSVDDVPETGDDSKPNVGDVPETGDDSNPNVEDGLQTGDNSNLILWMLMAVISLIGISGLVYQKWRKANR